MDGGASGQSQAGVVQNGRACCVESLGLFLGPKEVSTQAVMGPGWKEQKQGLTMTFKVPLHKKILNILYDHIGVKMDTIQAGLVYSWFSSDVKTKALS